jgi:hypothetical protein
MLPGLPAHPRRYLHRDQCKCGQSQRYQSGWGDYRIRADGVGGYLWSPDGTFTTFNPPGSTYMSPFAINPAGAITGYYCEGTRGCHGFLRCPDGTFTTFDGPGSTFTYGVAINSSGVITGAFNDAAASVTALCGFHKPTPRYILDLNQAEKLFL